MQNVKLKVQGMSCNHCAISITGALKMLGAAAIVDLAAGSAAVEFDEGMLTLDAIKAAIEQLGYEVIG